MGTIFTVVAQLCNSSMAPGLGRVTAAAGVGLCVQSAIYQSQHQQPAAAAASGAHLPSTNSDILRRVTDLALARMLPM